MAISPTMQHVNIIPFKRWANRWVYRFAQRLINFQCDRRGHQYPSRFPVKLLQYSADHGNVKAMSELGNMLYSSGACRADKRNGLEYLRRAAKLGDAQAQYLLGEVHYHGSPLVKPNRQMATHWLALAADNGHVLAQQKLNSVKENLAS